MDAFSIIKPLFQGQTPSLPVPTTVQITINVFSDPSIMPQDLISKTFEGNLTKSREERTVSLTNIPDEGSKEGITRRSSQLLEDELDSFEPIKENSYAFLHSFIFDDREKFEEKIRSLALSESDIHFIKVFLIKRVVSIKLRSEIQHKFTPHNPKLFIDNAIQIRDKVYYQRNSNCLRAVFRKIIEFMKHNKHCPHAFQLPNHDNLKSESYIRIITDLGIVERFEETLRSPEFRVFLLSASENGFRVNFRRWTRALAANPDADIRMGIYPADLDRALRDFQSKLLTAGKK